LKFEALKFTARLSVSRTPDEFAVLGCFRAILPGFEHAEPFFLEVFARRLPMTRFVASRQASRSPELTASFRRAGLALDKHSSSDQQSKKDWQQDRGHQPLTHAEFAGI
jgi:hypothetical protein